MKHSAYFGRYWWYTFIYFAVLFPCTYTLFKWYPIWIQTIPFTHWSIIDCSRSMNETSGPLLYLAACRDLGPLYLQINVTAERKHVTVTFSLVIHDFKLSFFLFSLCWAVGSRWNPPDPSLKRHTVENLQWVERLHTDLLPGCSLTPLPAEGTILIERH